MQYFLMKKMTKYKKLSTIRKKLRLEMNAINGSIYLLNQKSHPEHIFDCIKEKLTNIVTLAAIGSIDDFCNFDQKISQQYFFIIENFAQEAMQLVDFYSKRLVSN